MKRGSISRRLARGWLVWVSVAIVALAGFAVYRLQGAFGALDTKTPGGGADEISAYNPKTVVLEVFGQPGATARISYTDVHAQPQHVESTSLPWSHEESTTAPAVVANIMAQSDGGSLGCRITIDGEVKVERWVDAPAAYTYCLDKSG